MNAPLESHPRAQLTERVSVHLGGALAVLRTLATATIKRAARPQRKRPVAPPAPEQLSLEIGDPTVNKRDESRDVP